MVNTSATDVLGGSGFCEAISAFSQTGRRQNRGGKGVNRTVRHSSLQLFFPRTCWAWNSRGTGPGAGTLGRNFGGSALGIDIRIVASGITTSLRGAAGALVAGGARRGASK